MKHKKHINVIALVTVLAFALLLAIALGARPEQMVHLPIEKLGGFPGGIVMDVAVSPHDPDTLYLVNNVDGMGLWKTTDFGRTWERLYRHGHLVSVLLHPDYPERIYLLSKHDKVLRESRDGGETWGDWRGLYRGKLNSVAMHPDDPALMVGGTETGIALSADSGNTWSEKYIMFNLGLAEGIVDAEFHPEDPRTIIAGGRSLFRSRDGGDTWTRVLPELGGSGIIGEIAWSEENPSVIIVTASNGVYRSFDGGTTWVRDAIAFAKGISFNGNDVYIAASKGIYKNTLAGESWERIDGPFEDVGEIFIHPNEPKRIIAAAAGWETWGWHRDFYKSGPYEHEGIFLSEDGGATWEKSPDYYDTDAYTVAAHGDVLFAGTLCSRGAFRSTDGGKMWHYIEVGEQGETPNIMHYAMDIFADDDVIVMTGRDGSAVSHDNGLTWKELPFGGHSHGILKEGKRIFIGQSFFDSPDPRNDSSAHIWVSDDVGSTWRKSEEEPELKKDLGA